MKNILLLRFSKFYFIFIIFIILFFVFMEFQSFRLHKVFVNGFEVSDDVRNDLLKEQFNDILYFVDLILIRENVKNYYFTDTVFIYKSYPDSVFIDIMSDDVFAYVKLLNDNVSIFVAVNYKARVINVVDEAVLKSAIGVLPVVVVEIRDRVSDLTYDDLEKILESFSLSSILSSIMKLKNLGSDFYRKIKEIYLYDNYLYNQLFIRNISFPFRFGKSLDIKKLLYLIVLEKDLIGSSEFKFIDLRFDSIIAKY